MTATRVLSVAIVLAFVGAFVLVGPDAMTADEIGPATCTTDLDCACRGVVVNPGGPDYAVTARAAVEAGALTCPAPDAPIGVAFVSALLGFVFALVVALVSLPRCAGKETR